MLCGIGYHFLALCITVFTIIVLSIFGNVTYLIDKLIHSKNITVIFHNTDINNLEILAELCANHKVKSRVITLNKVEGRMTVTISAKGNNKKLSALEVALIKTPGVHEFY